MKGARRALVLCGTASQLGARRMLRSAVSAIQDRRWASVSRPSSKGKESD